MTEQPEGVSAPEDLMREHGGFGGGGGRRRY